MRVLLDTNIFIYREDYNVLSPNLSDLLKLFSSIKIEILVHPDSVDEINRDKNEGVEDVYVMFNNISMREDALNFKNFVLSYF